MPRRKVSPHQLSLFEQPPPSFFDAAPAKVEAAGPPEEATRSWAVVASGTCFPQSARIFCRYTPYGSTWARPNEGRELRVAHRFETLAEANAVAGRYDHFHAFVVPFGPDWMKEDEH